MTTNHKIREAETGAVPSRLKDGVSSQHRTNAPQLSPGVILNEVRDLLFLPHFVVILSAVFARRIPLRFLSRSGHYIRPSKDQVVFAFVSPYASTIGATDSTLADERNAVQVIENNHRGYTPLDTLVSVESCTKSEEKCAAEGRFLSYAANLKTAGARIVSRGVR